MSSFNNLFNINKNFSPQWQSRFAEALPAAQSEFKSMGLDDFSGPSKESISFKSTDNTFKLNLPFSAQVIEATGLNSKLYAIDRIKPGDAFEPRIPVLKERRIIDAAGDASLTEVFEDGALKVNIDPSQYDHLTRINIGRTGRIQTQQMAVQVNVTARDLETGAVIDLGTQSINPDNASFLVNLKNKLDAASTRGIMRDQYAINIETFIGDGRNRQVIESFEETITLIKPMQYGSNQLGDETANDFIYNNVGSAWGSGRIVQGRGGTDRLFLQGIRSTDVLSFNGRAGIDAASASELGQQAFYGGTVFDTLALKNGDELYLQGIERLHFSDITIDLTPNLDASSDWQWNTQVMDVNGAWRFNTGSDDVVLVSLDTGFDAKANGSPDVHGDLSHAINRTNTNTIVPDEDGNDGSDHGHQAMSVMASAHDGSQVAGVAPNASLWAYNVYNGGSSLYDAIDSAMTLRQGNQRLVFQGGIQGEGWWTSGSTREEMMNLLDSTAEVGFFSVAAGNGGPGGNLAQSWDPTDTDRYDPTAPDYRSSVSGVASGSNRFDNLASVGALQGTGWEDVDGLLNPTGTDLAGYSNRGKNLTLVAPTNSNSILNGDGSVRGFGGTSCANPNLAGVAALVWSENANIDGGELREILIGSAMDLGAGGFDNTFGFGLVNAEGAIRRAHALDQNQELASFWANNEFLA